MSKKILTIFMVLALVFTLTACGGQEKDSPDVDKPIEEDANDPVADLEEEPELEEETEAEEKMDISLGGMLVDDEPVEKLFTGTGPAKIETRLATMLIPEGLDYQVYQVPLEGDTSSMRIDFGVANTNAGFIEVSTTRMIKSLDDAANECIRTNDFGTMDSEIGQEITYGDKIFKEVTIQKPDGSRVDYFLVHYYEAENDWDGYIEVKTNGEGGAYKMDIKDPLIDQLLESIVLK